MLKLSNWGAFQSGYLTGVNPCLKKSVLVRLYKKGEPLLR
jgi:hypothetical protein